MIFRSGALTWNLDAPNGYLIQIWSETEKTFKEETDYLIESGHRVEDIEENYGSLDQGKWNLLYQYCK